jgi:hypothetical protein
VIRILCAVRARRIPLLLAVLLGAALLTGCAGRPELVAAVDRLDQPEAPGGSARPAHNPANVAEQPGGDASTLRLDRRRTDSRIASGGPQAPYNYAPSVLFDASGYRMWWCSQLPKAVPPGDDVVYARSESLNGPFSVPGGPALAVFSGAGPSSGGPAFDTVHVCDPSVIAVHGSYYLYYTGAARDREHANSIGVARSDDGVHWQRLSADPIVGPSGERRRDNDYGAGQPSALYLDGWFYLLFTDTSGAAAGWNGAGQFVLRATDPEFTEHVESLTGGGFRPMASTASSRSRSIVDAFSADWMWVDALRAFAVAHETVSGTTITFWDRDFATHPYRPVLLPGIWQEGPGLVRTAQGHAVDQAGRCARVRLDVVRATNNALAPTGLTHVGADLRAPGGCA